jgi:hypothetical protein
MFGLFQKQPAVEPPLPTVPTVWPPTTLSESGPRPARFTTQTTLILWALRITSILIVAIGIPVVLKRANVTERLAQHGEVIQAEVSNLVISRGKSTSYRVDYQYNYGGTSVYDDERVTQNEYNALAIGTTVSVTLLPSNPNVHRYGLVTANDARKEQGQGSLIVLLLSGAVAVGGLIFQNVARTQRQTLRDWLARPAQAIHLESKSAGKSGTTHTIRYRVLMPDSRIEDFVYSETGHAGPRAQPGDFFDALLNPENRQEAQPLWCLRTVEISTAPEPRLFARSS